MSARMVRAEIRIVRADLRTGSGAFGDLLFDMVIETWGSWPNHPEGIFHNELRAAGADMRHLQGAMPSWCGPAFSRSTEYEIRLSRVGADVVLAIGELGGPPGSGAEFLARRAGLMSDHTVTVRATDDQHMAWTSAMSLLAQRSLGAFLRFAGDWTAQYYREERMQANMADPVLARIVEKKHLRALLDAADAALPFIPRETNSGCTSQSG